MRNPQLRQSDPHRARVLAARSRGGDLLPKESERHNLSAKLDQLRQSARLMLQDEIAAELLDLVVGSEALIGHGTAVRQDGKRPPEPDFIDPS